jgi:hypothetical protein
MVSGVSVWQELDKLAEAFERGNGVRPNRLRIGLGVAEVLEPGHGSHPVHQLWESPAAGVWQPMRPVWDTGWVNRWLIRRGCRRDGGHFWHPEGAMIDWFCCRCGAGTDGMPRDGS